VPSLKIALDAMGGDFAPEQIVKGAVIAANNPERDFEIMLCGPEAIVKEELKKNDYSGNAITIIDAPDIVAMDESPTQALKTKPKSGLVTCVALQKQGLAQASVSAGNSGAMMAACLMVLGRAANVARPAIACAVPTAKRQTILLDCGANVDEKASVLLDFALCGSVYAEAVMGYEKPTVGLVNMGEEEKKGTEVLQEAHQLLKCAPLNFIGNIEGRDLINGHVDVAVAPGYTGNVILKMMEGFYELANNVFGDVNTEKSKEFNKLWDYRNHGGGLLLGLNGVGIITHGRADSIAINHSLFTACKFAKADVPAKIAEKLSTIKKTEN
jgi:glycerol-3-phosphate acyltransferase PlsX